MCVQNFSFLAYLEVAEKFAVGGVVVEHVATMSNLSPRLELLWVELGLGFDKKKCAFWKNTTLDYA